MGLRLALGQGLLCFMVVLCVRWDGERLGDGLDLSFWCMSV